MPPKIRLNKEARKEIRRRLAIAKKHYPKAYERCHEKEENEDSEITWMKGYIYALMEILGIEP